MGRIGNRAAWTHCRRGHLLEGENVWITKQGHRRCISCVNARHRGEDMTTSFATWRQPEQRFRAPVRSSYGARPIDDWRVFPRLVAGGDCWCWTGALTSGYGVFRIAPKNYYVHRWMYERLVGDVPAGLFLDHLCRNKRCCNPSHLDPVTNTVNVTRGLRAAS